MKGGGETKVWRRLVGPITVWRRPGATLLSLTENTSVTYSTNEVTGERKVYDDIELRFVSELYDFSVFYYRFPPLFFMKLMPLTMKALTNL